MRIEILNPQEKKPSLPFYRDAAAEYCKRLKRYAKVRCFSGPESLERMSSADKQTLTVRICKTGNSLSSIQLASILESSPVSGKSRILFLISEQAFAADQTLSLSRLQISPSLQTVLTLEQIYRGFRIINNQPYHK